ncbi:hypothetical protein TOREUM_40641 [Tenacibaculum litoreum]
MSSCACQLYFLNDDSLFSMLQKTVSLKKGKAKKYFQKIKKSYFEKPKCHFFSSFRIKKLLLNPYKH